MVTASLNTQSAVEHLIEIAGPNSVRVDAGAAAVAPSSIKVLSSVMGYANERGLPLMPVGGGTKLSWGYPVEAAIHLRVNQLNRVTEHIWQDMTCTVEAGATWASMQETLRLHGQCVALDPLWPDTATVGGIVATNDSGAWRLKYGSLRDLIIGMTIVLADGTIAKSGGKVVKNVAGYDLHKLMTGSMGTLGVIAEVTFRLHATAGNRASFTLSCVQAEPLGDLLLHLTGSQLSLRALQMRTATDSFHLDVCLETMPTVLAKQSAALRDIAVARCLTIQEAEDAVWGARQAEIDKASTENFAVKATMLPSNIAHFSSHVQGIGGTATTQAGGIMTAHLPGSSPEAVVVHLRHEIELAGGHLAVLKRPPSAGIPRWGSVANTLPLMQQIKRNLDPKRTLNPGHFLDGI